MKREYFLKIEVSSTLYRRVLIDPHYEESHSESVDDYLILELVKLLNGENFAADKILASGYQVFVTDPVWYGNQPYRLVWTTHFERNYIGVINAFRR